VQKEEKNLVR